MKVKLINPRFNQSEIFLLEPTAKVKSIGPFILLSEGDYFHFMLHFLYGVLSLGIWFIFFPKAHMKSKIYRALWKGYKPASAEDASILRRYKIKIADNEWGDKIGTSRLGSADHTFGRNLRDDP